MIFFENFQIFEDFRSYFGNLKNYFGINCLLPLSPRGVSRCVFCLFSDFFDFSEVTSEIVDKIDA